MFKLSLPLSPELHLQSAGSDDGEPMFGADIDRASSDGEFGSNPESNIEFEGGEVIFIIITFPLLVAHEMNHNNKSTAGRSQDESWLN